MDFYMMTVRNTTIKSVGGAKMANNKKKSDENLKGSLYAVFGVGIIIILLWVYCFDLFIGRF